MKKFVAEEEKFISENGKNESLVNRLKSFKAYINDDIPEWQQLMAIGGFVMDVIRCLKWSEQPVFSKSEFQCDERPVMSCDEICDEISAAIDNHIIAPYANELNEMFQDWNLQKTDRFKDIKNIEEMDELLWERLLQHFPNLLECVKQYYGWEVDNESNQTANF